MLPSDICALTGFSDPASEAQLKQLDSIVASVLPAQCGPDAVEALLGVFERFPESDGFGIFWSVLHLLEACDGYEAMLIASVIRSPGLFNTLMINRMINAGIEEAAGQSLVDVLRRVARGEEYSEVARTRAAEFLEYQGNGVGG